MPDAARLERLIVDWFHSQTGEVVDDVPQVWLHDDYLRGFELWATCHVGSVVTRASLAIDFSVETDVDLRLMVPSIDGTRLPLEPVPDRPLLWRADNRRLPWPVTVSMVALAFISASGGGVVTFHRRLDEIDLDQALAIATTLQTGLGLVADMT
jgi:hypothetical protein